MKGGAQNDIKSQAKKIESAIASSLKQLILLSSEELIQQRYEKYRQIENYK